MSEKKLREALNQKMDEIGSENVIWMAPMLFDEVNLSTFKLAILYTDFQRNIYYVTIESENGYNGVTINVSDTLGLPAMNDALRLYGTYEQPLFSYKDFDGRIQGIKYSGSEQKWEQNFEIIPTSDEYLAVGDVEPYLSETYGLNSFFYVNPYGEIIFSCSSESNKVSTTTSINLSKGMGCTIPAVGKLTVVKTDLITEGDMVARPVLNVFFLGSDYRIHQFSLNLADQASGWSSTNVSNEIINKTGLKSNLAIESPKAVVYKDHTTTPVSQQLHIFYQDQKNNLVDLVYDKAGWSIQNVNEIADKPFEVIACPLALQYVPNNNLPSYLLIICLDISGDIIAAKYNSAEKKWSSDNLSESVMKLSGGLIDRARDDTFNVALKQGHMNVNYRTVNNTSGGLDYFNEQWHNWS